MNIKAACRDVITHWPILGNDEYGGYTFGTPVTMYARWENSFVKFINADGEEVVSRAVVTLTRPVTVLDYIALGDLTDYAEPTQAIGAYQVRGYTRITNLRNSRNLMQAFI